MDKNNMDNLFDELLKKGASLVAEKMGEEAQEDNTEFSEKHKAKMEKLFARERRRQRVGRALTYTARIAAVFIIIAALSGLVIFRVDALRVRIFNMFTGTNPTNTDVVFHEGKEYVVGNMAADYIPEGFELSVEKSTDDMTLIRFEKGGDYFDIFVRNSKNNLSLDTENANVETVNLNGHEAFYTKKDDTNILTGYIGDNTISLIGSIDKNTLYKIYQHIEFN